MSVNFKPKRVALSEDALDTPVQPGKAYLVNFEPVTKAVYETNGIGRIGFEVFASAEDETVGDLIETLELVTEFGSFESDEFVLESLYEAEDTTYGLDHGVELVLNTEANTEALNDARVAELNDVFGALGNLLKDLPDKMKADIGVTPALEVSIALAYVVGFVKDKDTYFTRADDKGGWRANDTGEDTVINIPDDVLALGVAAGELEIIR